MKIENLNQPLVDFDGEPLTETKDGKTWKQMTFKSAIRIALLNVAKKWKDISDRDGTFQLAARISGADDSIEISPEELSEIRQAAFETLGTMHFGRVIELLPK